MTDEIVKGDDLVEGLTTGSRPGSEPGDGGSSPPPPVFEGAAEADSLIERWTERQAARGEQAEATAQEPASAPAPAPTRQGVEVIPLETFPWKGFLWQVLGFTKVIPTGEENAVSAVIVRCIAPMGRGFSRAERRAVRRAGQKVRG